MYGIRRKLLITLLTVGGLVYAPIGLTSEEEQTQQTTETAVPPVAETAEMPVTETPATETKEEQVPVPDKPILPLDGREDEGITEYPLLGEDKKGSEQTEQKSTIVSGAFGLTLGETFRPCMVTKVLSQKEVIYKIGARNNKTEHTGTEYQVEPTLPNQHFNEYLVRTNKDGIIYSIRGKQNPTEKKSACDVSRNLGKLLMKKYGRPRGAGLLGEWYAFRDMSYDDYRGIRLNAPRCRNGRYEIHYSDHAAMEQEATAQTAQDEMTGL